MTSTEQYYRWAGYCSLPCVLIPILITLVVQAYSFAVNLSFNVLALALAISGVWRGSLGAKVCSLVSLLIFVLSALAFIGFLTEYMR